jgi:NhaA family Na+:H+ antiporter
MPLRSTKYNANNALSVITKPFQEFFRLESASGILLAGFMLLALIWANSPWKESYEAVWNTEVSIGLSSARLSKTLLHWINDGFMTVFFLLVGLEIKRELLIGELAEIKKATLPIAAALGGMIVPALIYIAINHQTSTVSGWGVPMATDIAFSLGVLTLLGKRVPYQLKIFLTAFAIVDDLGAVLVIAIFYTSEISFIALGATVVALAALLVLNKAGVQRLLPYLLVGLLLWLAVLKSGVHATIAGVILAMTIPARRHSEQDEEGTEGTPLQTLEHALHPWVSFIIMPVFALSNAGVELSGQLLSTVLHPVSLGIILGLLLGKQIGILLFSWLAVRTGIGSLPTSVRWLHVYGTSLLGGIGFTMSLFIAVLAFGEGHLLSIAKIGVLVASGLAGTAGWMVLRKTKVQVSNSASSG